VLLACGGYWLARNKPWRGGLSKDRDAVPARDSEESRSAELARRSGLAH
jgi:hypothetical protein